MVGMRVCEFHGGKTPSGPASPHYKHGRYSKHFPTRLARQFAQMQEDPELLGLREEAAVAATRVAELICELDAEGGGELWGSATRAYDGIQEALRKKDLPAVQNGLADLGAILRRGKRTESRWNQIQRWIETRGRVVATEARRMKDMQVMMTAEQAGAMIGAITEVITRNVSDSETLAKISRGLGALLSGDSEGDD